MGLARVDFRFLHSRLISAVRTRVRNGEISERGLARLTGISQPHIHHVLKGVRLLSQETADLLLERLRIDLADLLAGESGEPVQPAAAPKEYRLVPLLEGVIGAHHPYPSVIGDERYPFAAPEVERVRSPVAARLAPDPLNAPVFRSGGVLLLDNGPEARLEIDEQGVFTLDLPGGGMVGLVRRSRSRFSFWIFRAGDWQSVRVRDREPLDVIQGRVRLFVHPV
jgi:transcriptional regulator with XRE-family HTH domain